MFDTMTLVKIVGGFCGTLALFVIAFLAGDSIYGMKATGHDGVSMLCLFAGHKEGFMEEYSVARVSLTQL